MIRPSIHGFYRTFTWFFILVSATSLSISCWGNSAEVEPKHKSQPHFSDPFTLKKVSTQESSRPSTGIDAEAILRRIDTYGVFAGSKREYFASRAVRVVFLFNKEVAYRLSDFPSSNGPTSHGTYRRLFLDLESVRIATMIPSHISVSEGGLNRIRPFRLSDSMTRVALDVDDSVHFRLFHLNDPYRIVLDLHVEGRNSSTKGKQNRTQTVVLDPGHGGIHAGARSPTGLKESVVTLDLAKRVARKLQKLSPRAQIFLTRDKDRTVSLEERTAIANGYGADLFVSIHLNASPSVNDKGGVSTFILDNSNSRQAVRLAAIENATSERNITELQKILASLYRKEQVVQSSQLARLIHSQTLAFGRKMLPDLTDRGVRSALFYVLVGARMPAILVEASFITRFEESKALEKDRYRQLLAEGIAHGIFQYLTIKRK